MQPKSNNASVLMFFLLLLETTFLINNVESKCLKGCPLASASYYAQITTLGNITRFLRSDLVSDFEIISNYNQGTVSNGKYIKSFTRINIPFPCDCINNGEFLGHVFEYTISSEGETYDSIATKTYSSLTTVDLLRRFNNYGDPNKLPLNGTLSVPVNCYCGNRQISKDYGLFITYPLGFEDSLESIVKQTHIDATLLQSYNPGVNFGQQSGVVFIPTRDNNGHYVTLDPRSRGLSGVVIAGICVGATLVFLLLAAYVIVRYFRRKTINVANESCF